jgi:NAD kinase
MQRATENKIILVTRRTRLDELIARFNTLAQAKFYLEHLGADFDDYVVEEQNYRSARQQVESTLGRLGRLQVIDRAFLPNFLFGPGDLVVALGQDGLVANTLKYTLRHPVIGVNPDPLRWDGVLLPFVPGDLPKIVSEVFAGRRPFREVTLAQAELNTGEKIYAVNDLFIGVQNHTSARYHIRLGGRAEQHSSSGLIVSTGLGSTGWLRSLLAGATAIAKASAGGNLDLPAPEPVPWDADYLYFTVREPFPSRTTGTTLVFDRITAAEPLVLTSQMPERGVIFSDGIDRDFLAFNSGACATISVAATKAQLVV